MEGRNVTLLRRRRSYPNYCLRNLKCRCFDIYRSVTTKATIFLQTTVCAISVTTRQWWKSFQALPSTTSPGVGIQKTRQWLNSWRRSAKPPEGYAARKNFRTTAERISSWGSTMFVPGRTAEDNRGIRSSTGEQYRTAETIIVS